MNLKVKIIASNDMHDTYKEMLEKAGFIISEDANLIFKEQDTKRESVLGKKDDKYEVIPYIKILYIESFGHDVYVKLMNDSYLVKERLYELEIAFSEQSFIRINKSMIVNKYGIKEIIPSFNSRLTLVMKNDDVLYVSRSYLPMFKEFIGF